jgi:hypothetical protein
MNWKRKFLSVTLVLAACGTPFAEQTNTASKLDYSFFRIIPDRNIFNPNRYPHRSGTRRTDSAHGDAFQLVGTMSYKKGTFAFFDGSNADYQKVLERDGSIAGFTLTAIGPDVVILTVSNKPVELKVGDQMHRDEEAGWQLVQGAEAPSVSASPSIENTDAPAEDIDGGQNDVLRKLMQRREEELK